jgi:curved DNA-binding protein CbpA
MSAPSTTLVDTLTDLLGQQKTGALDLQEGKKRWRFYLETGALVGSLSNLKSEQPDTLAAAHPGTGASEIARLVILRRLQRGDRAVEAGATLAWREGMVPKARASVSTSALLAEAFGISYEPETSSDDIGALIDRALTDSGEWSVPAIDAHVAVRRSCRQISLAKDHFEVFGLTPEAGPEQLRAAYLALAQDLHPDRMVGAAQEIRELVTHAFDRVNGAWEVLKDDAKRGAYVRHEIKGEMTDEQVTMERVEAYFDAEAAFRKGMGAFQSGRLVQAHAFFDQALLKAPHELEFRAYHGFTTYMMNRQGDPKVAKTGIKTIRDVLEANKNQARKLDGGWVLLGRIYREEGELERAKICMVKALKLNPSNADAKRELRRVKREEEEKPKGGLFGGIFKK